MLERLRGLYCAVALSFRADWRRALLLAALFGLRPLSPIATAYGIKLVIDAIRLDQARTAIEASLAVALVTAVGLVGSFYGVRVSTRLIEVTMRDLDLELMAISTRVPGIEHHERPEHLDRLELIASERIHLAEGADVSSLLLGSILRMGATAVVLALVSPWLLTIPLLAIPTLISGSRAERSRQRALTATAAESRRAKHFFELATTTPPAKELRLSGLQTELVARHDAGLRLVNRSFDRAAILGMVITLAGWLGFGLGYAAIAIFVVRLALAGAVTLGEVGLILTLIASISAQMSNAIRYTNAVNRALAAGSRLLELRDWAKEASAVPRGSQKAPARVSRGVELKGIRFRYPGQKNDVLKSLDLVLPTGALVGIVGENGAGKTTLMKLLTRMYEPTEGQILVDGVELRDIELESWRARCSAAFQDFARFELLLRETVGVGHLPDLDDRAAVTRAIEQAAATDVVAALDDGLDAELGQSFASGTDLSGGQWQKLALARSMMRPAPALLVLDEPTAAIDAEAEHALLERYASAAKSLGAASGTVTLFVSHRLTSLRHADLVVVLDAGEAVEVGTHEALVAKGGIYANLYTRQARAYL